MPGWKCWYFPKFENIEVRLGATMKQLLLSMVENVDISQVREYCNQAWCHNELIVITHAGLKMLIFPPKFENIEVRLGATMKQLLLSMVENVNISQVREYCNQAWCHNELIVITHAGLKMLIFPQIRELLKSGLVPQWNNCYCPWWKMLIFSQVREYCNQAWCHNELIVITHGWKCWYFPKFENIEVRLGATMKQLLLSMVENVDISQVREYCCQAWCLNETIVIVHGGKCWNFQSSEILLSGLVPITR